MSTDVQGPPVVPVVSVGPVVSVVPDLLTLGDVTTAALEPFRPPPSLDDLDEQLLSLLLRRAGLARQEQLLRRENGLPVRLLAQENAMSRRYVEGLGPSGAEIAAAVLALTRAVVSR